MVVGGWWLVVAFAPRLGKPKTKDHSLVNICFWSLSWPFAIASLLLQDAFLGASIKSAGFQWAKRLRFYAPSANERHAARTALPTKVRVARLKRFPLLLLHF